MCSLHLYRERLTVLSFCAQGGCTTPVWLETQSSGLCGESVSSLLPEPGYVATDHVSRVPNVDWFVLACKAGQSCEIFGATARAVSLVWGVSVLPGCLTIWGRCSCLRQGATLQAHLQLCGLCECIYGVSGTVWRPLESFCLVESCPGVIGISEVASSCNRSVQRSGWHQPPGVVVGS